MMDVVITITYAHNEKDVQFIHVSVDETLITLIVIIHLDVNNIFLKEDFIRKSSKNYTTYKIYTYMYIPQPAAYTNTTHNTK